MVYSWPHDAGSEDGIVSVRLLVREVEERLAGELVFLIHSSHLPSYTVHPTDHETNVITSSPPTCRNDDAASPLTTPRQHELKNTSNTEFQRVAQRILPPPPCLRPRTSANPPLRLPPSTLLNNRSPISTHSLVEPPPVAPCEPTPPDPPTTTPAPWPPTALRTMPTTLICQIRTQRPASFQHCNTSPTPSRRYRRR